RGGFRHTQDFSVSNFESGVALARRRGRHLVGEQRIREANDLRQFDNLVHALYGHIGLVIATQRKRAMCARGSRILMTASGLIGKAARQFKKANGKGGRSPCAQRRYCITHEVRNVFRSSERSGQPRPTRRRLPPFGQRGQAFALRQFPGSFARPSDGFCLLAGFALGRFFVRLATLHLTKNALGLHLLFEGPESLFDIVIANEYVSNRAAAALVGGRDVASDQSRSTDLKVVRRLLAAITDNLIFDCLTLVERTKAGTL